MVDDVLGWLLDGDPAIRWQVERDLLGAPADVWRSSRALVETAGWGGRLLAHQDADGQWAGGSFAPADFDWATWESEGQPWTATYPSLVQLREFGLDPDSASARRTVTLVGANSRWDEGGQPFWSGEVEPCINGMTVAVGARFGVDVSSIVARLLAERLPDGGWNCEAANGSVVTSFDTTINVLEGLLEYEAATGRNAEVTAARHAGEAYLLDRGLFRRLSTGAPADPGYLQLGHPFRWHHSVLRGLDYFRRAAQADDVVADQRLAEAVSWLRSVRGEDGAWWQQVRHGGRTWFDMEAVGQPSRWLTLYALGILRWWDAAGTA